MRLPRADWQARSGMAPLLATLGAGEGLTRYIGGCVRDTLLGLPVNDVDLATRLRPDEVMERLVAARIKCVPTGIDHGTVTAIIAGKPVEVTTLRRDVSTDGRRATVEYSDDWREDAARRDFTINALSARPSDGALFDYFGGLEDLEARRVRFIGEPLQRIAEDHLRILRFFRFHARFGVGDPDSDGLAACSRRANDLMALSRERIADELIKLLQLADPAPTASLMVEQGILRPVLPEIDAAGAARLVRLVAREHASGTEPAALRRLAALLPAEPAVAAAIAARLRLSKKAAKRLVTAASPYADEDPFLLAYRIGAEGAIDRILLGEGDSKTAAMLEEWQRPTFPVSGGELLRMGLPAGPAVARTLAAVERAWCESGFALGAEELRAIARQEVERALRSSQ